MEKISNQTRVRAKVGTYTAAELAAAESRTATATGATTGTISATAKVVAPIGSGTTTHLIILPAPVVGKQILLLGAVAAYTLATNGATVKLNGAGTNAGTLTVAATMVIEVLCTSATNWVITRGNGAIA
jgi:hypothetical protein